MIIDFHTHILDKSWLPQKWWQWIEDYYANSWLNYSVSDLYDPFGERLIHSMNDANIDISVILPLDFGLLLGEPDTPIEEQNRLISEVVKKHENRLVAFVGVDPRRPNALEIIEYGINELNMKGVKLYPGTGFIPDLNGFCSLFEKISEMQIPVMVHTGQTFGPLLSKYCRPTYLDEILASFMKMKIIAAHMGGGWFDEICWMGQCKNNLYTDISMWQKRYKQNKNDFALCLKKALDMFGFQKILFGTDWPFTSAVMTQKSYVQAILNLTKEMSFFLSSEINGILGNNAKALLPL